MLISGGHFYFNAYWIVAEIKAFVFSSAAIHSGPLSNRASSDRSPQAAEPPFESAAAATGWPVLEHPLDCPIRS